MSISQKSEDSITRVPDPMLGSDILPSDSLQEELEKYLESLIVK